MDSNSIGNKSRRLRAAVEEPLSRFRKKPEVDEWYIPYRPPPNAHQDQEISHRPRKFPPLPPTPPYPVQSASRIPSSSSVPTGLSAPKLLFSPLSRQVHAVQVPQPLDTPRKRTVSAPVTRHWEATTVCDRLVIAKPHLTPHIITPPGSPEDEECSVFGEKAVRDAAQRVKEREEWARYTRRRARSMGRQSSSFHSDEGRSSHFVTPARHAYSRSSPNIYSHTEPSVVVIGPEPLDTGKPLPALPISKSSPLSNFAFPTRMQPPHSPSRPADPSPNPIETSHSPALSLSAFPHPPTPNLPVNPSSTRPSHRTRRAFQSPNSSISSRLSIQAIDPPQKHTVSSPTKTIKPIDDSDLNDGFKGLFFRTPQDVPLPVSRGPPQKFHYQAEDGHGLLERSSTDSGETIEITTPYDNDAHDIRFSPGPERRVETREGWWNE